MALSMKTSQSFREIQWARRLRGWFGYMAAVRYLTRRGWSIGAAEVVLADFQPAHAGGPEVPQ